MNAVDADARRGDGVPRLLGRGLVRETHLRRQSGDDGLERALVIVVWEVAVLDGVVLELVSLHLDLHEQSPLVVVGLGQHQPWSAHAGVLVHRLDSQR